MRTKKVGLAILLLVSLVVAGILYRHFFSTIDRVKKGLGDVSVDLSLGGVTLRQGKGGRLLWTLNATSANYQKNNGLIFLTNPKILYFQKDRSAPLYIEGDRGKISQKRDQAFIWSHVKARYQDALVTTEWLHYDGNRRMLLFEKGIVMKRGDLHLTADTGDFDFKDEYLRLRGHVRAKIFVSSLPR